MTRTAWDSLIDVVTAYVSDQALPGCDSDRAVILAQIERTRAAVARPALPAPPPCPDCGAELKPVRYPGGSLNPDQWHSVRAGDFYCESPVPHPEKRYRSSSAIAYFWKSEVGAALPAPEPPPENKS